MKHSVQDLITISQEYFPRGIIRRDPRYEQTPEVQRQKAARIPASLEYDNWRAMLRRLEARFPQSEWPGLAIHNRSLFLQIANASDMDRGFSGELWLPVRSADEHHHKLEFLISFVVPYYILRSSCLLYTSRYYVTMQPSHDALETKTSFDMSSDEVPFARSIAEEIETTFPGYEPISPEVGLTVVPDVQAGSKWFGESTIFTCLFSDSW